MRQPLANTPITRIPIPLWERVPRKHAPTEQSDANPGDGFARERSSKGWPPHPPRAFDARHPLAQGEKVGKNIR
jgi:hypothetical protein